MSFAITLAMAGVSLAVPEPALSDNQKGSPGQGRVCMQFPTKYSLGHLFPLMQDGSLDVQKGRPYIDARGLVCVPRNQFFQLKLSFDGVDRLQDLVAANPKNVVSVYLRDLEGINDASLLQLLKLKNLVALHLDGTDVTDKGIITLGNMAKLEQLTLTGTLIHGRTLDALANCKHLVSLSVSDNELNEEACSRLSKIQSLVVLYMERCQLNDACLKYLSELPNVKFLNMSNNPRITDKSAGEIGKMKKLLKLGLYETGVTDACAVDLKGLPYLYAVDLGGKGNSTLHPSVFRKALPKCKFTFAREYRFSEDTFQPLHDTFNSSPADALH